MAEWKKGKIRTNEVLFTFSFMVDDIDKKVFLLELVFRGGECSVASSRRLNKTLPAVPHHVARDKAQQKVDQRITPS